MKVAFDQNVPIVLVKVFQAFANERQFRKTTGQFEIKTAAYYTPKPGDYDYSPKNDVPWVKRFVADGGRAIISGDTNMKYVPHERLALIETGLIVIFFENQWSDWKFFRKCALLIHWWPIIAAKIKRGKKGAFWHIPCHWKEDGSLRKISNDDPRKLKLEKKTVEGKRKRLPTTAKPDRPTSDGPLFDFAAATSTRKKTNGRRQRKDDPQPSETG